jgi:uncharacterized membrane protein affecting hemolysin expression
MKWDVGDGTDDLCPQVMLYQLMMSMLIHIILHSTFTIRTYATCTDNCEMKNTEVKQDNVHRLANQHVAFKYIIHRLFHIIQM